MSRPPRLGYCVRFTDDLDAAVRFYAEALRQRLVKRTDHWAQFDVGEVTFGLYERSAMAAALEVPAESLGSPPGGFEMAFEVDDCDAAYRAALRAGARGFREPADRPWGERTGYVLDPDGALVELYTPVRRVREVVEEVAAGADAARAERHRESSSPSSQPTNALSDPNA